MLSNENKSIEINHEKTQHFAKFVNLTFAKSDFYDFGYTTCQEYLITFGGCTANKFVNGKGIDNIYVFDFKLMKWFESDIVKLFPFVTLSLHIMYTCVVCVCVCVTFVCFSFFL